MNKKKTWPFHTLQTVVSPEMKSFVFSLAQRDGKKVTHLTGEFITKGLAERFPGDVEEKAAQMLATGVVKTMDEARTVAALIPDQPQRPEGEPAEYDTQEAMEEAMVRMGFVADEMTAQAALIALRQTVGDLRHEEEVRQGRAIEPTVNSFRQHLREQFGMDDG